MQFIFSLLKAASQFQPQRHEEFVQPIVVVDNNPMIFAERVFASTRHSHHLFLLGVGPLKNWIEHSAEVHSTKPVHELCNLVAFLIMKAGPAHRLQDFVCALLVHIAVVEPTWKHEHVMIQFHVPRIQYLSKQILITELAMFLLLHWPWCACTSP